MGMIMMKESFLYGPLPFELERLLLWQCLEMRMETSRLKALKESALLKSRNSLVSPGVGSKKAHLVDCLVLRETVLMREVMTHLRKKNKHLTSNT